MAAMAAPGRECEAAARRPPEVGVPMSPRTRDDAGSAAELIEFWKTAGRERWFAKHDAFDAEFRERYMDLHLRAARRELDGWADTAGGALALVLLLDQFPRNAFRGTAHMYATDPLARVFAARAVRAGFDREVDAELRPFLYLPYMHSEDLADQERSVELNAEGDEDSRKFALGHRDIIRRFGRFPHRNALLGRESTAEELAFLEQGGFAG